TPANQGRRRRARSPGRGSPPGHAVRPPVARVHRRWRPWLPYRQVPLRSRVHSRTDDRAGRPGRDVGTVVIPTATSTTQHSMIVEVVNAAFCTGDTTRSEERRVGGGWRT